MKLTNYMVEMFCFTLLIILCVGSPDILDGLIKRANETACEAKP